MAGALDTLLQGLSGGLLLSEGEKQRKRMLAEQDQRALDQALIKNQALFEQGLSQLQQKQPVMEQIQESAFQRTRQQARQQRKDKLDELYSLYADEIKKNPGMKRALKDMVTGYRRAYKLPPEIRSLLKAGKFQEAFSMASTPDAQKAITGFFNAVTRHRELETMRKRRIGRRTSPRNAPKEALTQSQKRLAANDRLKALKEIRDSIRERLDRAQAIHDQIVADQRQKHSSKFLSSFGLRGPIPNIAEPQELVNLRNELADAERVYQDALKKSAFVSSVERQTRKQQGKSVSEAGRAIESALLDLAKKLSGGK